jgi:hypothetical protein
MDPVESKIRRFAAAFSVIPEFRNWVRTRARELNKQGEEYEIVLVWGRRCFHVGRVPEGNPYFAIRRRDGTIESSPYRDG